MRSAILQKECPRIKAVSEHESQQSGTASMYSGDSFNAHDPEVKKRVCMSSRLIPNLR